MLQHWFIVKTVKFLFKPLKDAVEWQQGAIKRVDDYLQKHIDKELKM